VATFVARASPSTSGRFHQGAGFSKSSQAGTGLWGSESNCLLFVELGGPHERYSPRFQRGEFSENKVARPGRLELPTLCLEGRRSIQLSYGRVACFCDPITELTASAIPVSGVPIPRCAQNCAHSALTWLRIRHLRMDERTARRSQ
jgi:hypothetical protein